MGFSVNIKDVEPVEVSPGVFKRAMMKENMKGKGPPGNLIVNHYTLKEGGVLTIGEPGVEYQDYIISGSALFGKRYIHANTTIFAPTGAKHTYVHSGESDLRILSHGYIVPFPSHKWCKTRLSQLTDPYEQQLMTEEFHGLVGSHRFHALDVQTWDRSEHTNPMETAYFMRGKGEMLAGSKWYPVEPGSLVYVEEGETHAIKTQKPDTPLHYFVMEYVEQDLMWRQRGHL